MKKEKQSATLNFPSFSIIFVFQCGKLNETRLQKTKALKSFWRHFFRNVLHYRNKCQTPLHGHRLRTCCTTHQRMSSQQFYNLLYNKFTTNGQKFVTSQHLYTPRCWAPALRCGKFIVQQVVELLALYTSVAGVRVVEFGTN